MKVCHRPQPPLPKTPPGPAPKPKREAGPAPPSDKVDVFWQSSARSARFLAQVGGASNGGSLGYLGGALLAGTQATSGHVALGLAVVGAGLGGVVGWQVMGRVSDWAGKTAVRMLPSQPLRSEALGRAGLNLAMDVLSGSTTTAAADVAITFGWGGYRAWKSSRLTPG